jgi:hypothetical protein
VVQQYPTSLIGRRRTAYMDRLVREFPHISRKSLVTKQYNKLKNVE